MEEDKHAEPEAMGEEISRMMRGAEEAEATSSPQLPPPPLPLLLLRPPLDGCRDQPGRRLGRLGSLRSNDMTRRAGGRPLEPSGPAGSPTADFSAVAAPNARDAAPRAVSAAAAAVVLARVRSRSNENTRRAACRPPPAAAPLAAADGDPAHDDATAVAAIAAVAAVPRGNAGPDVALPDSAPPAG